MTYSGRCQCGAIEFQLEGEPGLVSLCHCTDCRRSSGAPVMGWAEFAEDKFSVSKGTPKTVNSSGAAMRSFCPECGTGLTYRNQEVVPDLVEVALGHIAGSEKLVPSMQIVTAERLGWMEQRQTRPGHAGFPE